MKVNCAQSVASGRRAPGRRPDGVILEFKSVLENSGYTLLDEHEHEFEKDGVHYSYAPVEELEPFAGIGMEQIQTICMEDFRFKLLTLPQYLKVYTVSSKDGYRVTVREKKDADKIAFIQKKLQEEADA